MAAVGVLLATIGPQPVVAQTRLTFGFPMLDSGISFIAASIGLFAIPEVMEAFEKPTKAVKNTIKIKLKSLVPSAQDFREAATAFPMGALVGFIGGILPGSGATVSSFIAYDIQKKISRYRSKFGKGSIEAVAAVEGANNAASTGALVPLLTLGIPGSGTAAVLMGAMLIHGLRPGPMLFESSPDVVWSLIGSMYIGNVMLLILNLPLIGLWISALRLPPNIIISAVLALSVIGVYAEDNTIDNVVIMFFFGIFGYILKKLSFPAAPVVLALILTAQMEGAFFKSMALSGDDWTVFFRHPVALSFFILAVLSLALQVPACRRLIAGIQKQGRSGPNRAGLKRSDSPEGSL
jgi:putative tricarboxylic transport membrane protein